MQRPGVAGDAEARRARERQHVVQRRRRRDERVSTGAGRDRVGAALLAWSPCHYADEAVPLAERAGECVCFHKRQCLRGQACIDRIGVGEVLDACTRRLAAGRIA